MPFSRSRSIESMTALVDVLVGAEGAGLPEHGVDERGLAVVDVGDDRDVAQLVDGLERAHRRARVVAGWCRWPTASRSARRSPRCAARSAARLGRVRSSWFGIAQTALAAAIAWALASLVNDNPFFAPISAVISLGLARGRRTLRAVELTPRRGGRHRRRRRHRARAGDGDARRLPRRGARDGGRAAPRRRDHPRQPGGDLGDPHRDADPAAGRDLAQPLRRRADRRGRRPAGRARSCSRATPCARWPPPPRR